VVEKLDLITSTELNMLAASCRKGQVSLLKHIEFLWHQDHQTSVEKMRDLGPVDPPLSQSRTSENSEKISTDKT
jgi:hypothetical protein